MEQKRDFADERLTAGCAYCGGHADTRDHVPPKVLLEPPFPENLPAVNACTACNLSFSLDEEYFACLVEAAIAGSAAPEAIQRPSVAAILRHSAALGARIEASRQCFGDRVGYVAEDGRIANVVLKLARGHALYELSQECRGEPSGMWCLPLLAMSDEDRRAYEASHVIDMFGEVGSRQSQRALVLQVVSKSEAGDEQRFGFVVADWVDVQDGVYRYLTIDDHDEIRVKIVVREYLACGAVWAR